MNLHLEDAVVLGNRQANEWRVFYNKLNAIRKKRNPLDDWRSRGEEFTSEEEEAFKAEERAIRAKHFIEGLEFELGYALQDLAHLRRELKVLKSKQSMHAETCRR